jgi:glutamine amidotransferase-like uncharacterized protein
MIYIYADYGTGHESVRHTAHFVRHHTTMPIAYLMAPDVCAGHWTRNARLFILPGGFDRPYVRKLSGKGDNEIRQYIINGGSFLGICAGSYYASSCIEFNKNGDHPICEPRRLSLFDGMVQGPHLKAYDPQSKQGACVARLSTIWDDVPETHAFYNGGGVFINADRAPKTTVLAQYSATNKPAIIHVKKGRGNVILSSPHFEYDPVLMDYTDPWVQQMIFVLWTTQTSRHRLGDRIMQVLGIPCHVDQGDGA